MIMFRCKVIDTVECGDVYFAGRYDCGGLVLAHDGEVGIKFILHCVGGHHQQLPCPLCAGEDCIFGSGCSVGFRLLVHHIGNRYFAEATLPVLAHAVEHRLIKHWRLQVAAGEGAQVPRAGP